MLQVEESHESQQSQERRGQASRGGEAPSSQVGQGEKDREMRGLER